MVSLSESGNITIETHNASSAIEEKIIDDQSLRSFRGSTCNKDEKFYSMAIRDSGYLEPVYIGENESLKASESIKSRKSQTSEDDQNCCLTKCMIS